MKLKTGSRNPAMDLIRCFAFFCVVGVHFFKYTGFYEQSVAGMTMYWVVLLRTGFMICVPLFLMLSGYLMKTRQPTRSYYSKIWKTVILYLLASFCCGWYRAYAYRVYWHQPVPVKELILGVFSFQTAPYGWYIGMYLGLFALIPYLNILYQNLNTQKGRQTLILILLALTALPGVANTLNATDPAWWRCPSSSTAYNTLVPDYWVDLYPITYYFIGAYLRDYPLQLKRRTNLLLIILAFFLFGSYGFYRSYPGNFDTGFWTEAGSLITATQAVLVFSFLSRLDCSRLPSLLKWILARLSDWCLGAYLVSGIYDEHFYSYLRDDVPHVLDRMDHFLPVVLKICVHSLALSALLTTLYTVISLLVSRLRKSPSTPL